MTTARAIVGTAVVCAAMGAQGQGLMPLSRVVEQPYAPLLHRYRTQFHTSVRPYLRNEVDALPGADTLAGRAALGFMDRWAGAGSRNKWRGGILLDAQVGASLDEKEVMKHRVSDGFWLDWNANEELAFHADAQVWNEGVPNYLDSLFDATQVSLGEGYAEGDGPYTHYDWNAHVNWHPQKYFHFTLGRGKNFIGEGHRSMFLSANATSYPYFKITTTAWHIRYVNLFTVMNDVRGAGGDPWKFQRKYASFHYLSWLASKRVSFGVFESIVWQDNDPDYPRGFDINYLNPVIVYRPLEYAQGSADNALLGFAMNVKAGNHTTLYSQLMLDEFLLKEVRAGKGWYGNKQALQLGVAAYEAFRVPGLFLRTEWNYVRPFMYTHSDTRQNYAHFGQPLAHPYGSNFWELIQQVEFQKDRWRYKAHISYALLGSDTGAYSYGNNIFRPEGDRPDVEPEKSYGYYVGDQAAVQVFHTDLSVGWLVDPRSGMHLEAGYTFRSRVPEHGDDTITNYFRLGIATHFRDRQADQEGRYVLE